jgi:hypothetical protein
MASWARHLAPLVVGSLVALAWTAPSLAAPPAAPAPPESELDPEPPTTRIEGQLREAGGSRAAVSGAKVVLVNAPPGLAEVRPGKPAKIPLDPESLTWIVEAESDDEGRFVIPDVPVGPARLVIVAGGYERVDQWVAIEPGGRLDRFVAPEASGLYRTEVVVERERISEPTHILDAQQARHYAGGGDDPVLVALNLPGAARTPGGFGLLSLRGGNPTETGVYLDGHPVPRAFHIIPIASVVSPPMTSRVELSPGNYGPGYGSFTAGLVEISSRAGRRDGIHGETHLDLFDVGSTLEAPVGAGSVHFGLRRSHVDAVLIGAEQVIGDTGILLPSYWDYLGRFDYPLAGGHSFTVRALGAGDQIRDRQAAPSAGPAPSLFEFSSGFHRFDLDYRWARGPWRLLVSPSIRLDSSQLEQFSRIRRDAKVFSGRVELDRRLSEWLTLQVGSDLVYENWRRTQQTPELIGVAIDDPSQVVTENNFRGEQARLGAWVAAVLRIGQWSVVPALRVNVFAYADRVLVRPDPRLDIRGQVHPNVAVFGRVGAYATPVVLSSGGARTSLITQNGQVFGGIADVPSYLIAFFDPGIEGELRDGSASSTYAMHGSTGVEAALPWQLDLRGTVFWREVLSTSVPVYFDDGSSLILDSSRRRAAGLELLLRRALGPQLDGWIGYTLMWSRQQFVDRGDPRPWQPGIFDQRHNLVVLLSASLPRNFRLGMRFRVVSGNPESPVLGGEAVSWDRLGTYYRPIRGEFGSRYQPVFHQLDLRLDKRWVRDRASVSVYLDVQNIYNNVYPEVPVYTRDWSQRSSLVGLPIFPSLGVQVEY